MWPSEHFTKKRIRSEKVVVSPADGEGDGEVDPDGLTDADGEREAEGERLADGDLLAEGDDSEGETDAEGEREALIDGLADAEGEREADGERELDVTVSPISIKAWLQDKVSFIFLVSRFEPNLNAPFIPLSSKSLIAPLNDVIS